MAEGSCWSGQPAGGSGNGFFCLGLVLAGCLLLLPGAAIQAQRGVHDMCAGIGRIDDVAVFQAPSLAPVSDNTCMAWTSGCGLWPGADGTLVDIDYRYL